MDPVYELAAALIARLKADSTIVSKCGSRVYERVPDDEAASPYISMGPWDATGDDAECINSLEVTFQFDCWSWGSGDAFSRKEASALANAIRRSLNDAEFEISSNALATINHRITRYTREADGVTNRAIVTITAVVEERG